MSLRRSGLRERFTVSLPVISCLAASFCENTDLVLCKCVFDLRGEDLLNSALLYPMSNKECLIGHTRATEANGGHNRRAHIITRLQVSLLVCCCFFSLIIRRHIFVYDAKQGKNNELAS